MIAITTLAPMQAQALPAKEENNNGGPALLLLGMITVVVFSSQAGWMATRDGNSVMVIPEGAGGDLGFDVAE